MKQIDELRKQIDEIDTQIMKLLDERFSLSSQVGNVKKAHKLPIHHQNREQDILNKTSKFRHFPAIKSVYKTIFQESKKLQ
jgi:chorismate mutase